jgi:hypothetical protein
MRGHRKTDCVSRFARFDERVERLGDDVGLFFVVTQDGKARTLPDGNSGNPLQQIKSLVEVENWRPLGLFSLSLDEASKQQTEVGTEAIHVERFLYRQPPSTEDAALFDKAIAETIERLTENAQ